MDMMSYGLRRAAPFPAAFFLGSVTGHYSVTGHDLRPARHRQSRRENPDNKIASCKQLLSRNKIFDEWLN